MKTRLLFNVLLLVANIPFFAFSQVKFQEQPTVKTHLKWKNPIETKVSEETILRFLSFENARHDALAANLPVYFQLIPLSGHYTNTSIEARISETEFEPLVTPLTTEELKHVSFEIIPTVKLAYDQKRPVASVSFIPIRINPTTNQAERLISFNLKIVSVVQPATLKKNYKRNYALNSVLASGKWFKIGVTKDGVYKLTHAQLETLGMDTDSMLSQNIRIYGNGGGMLPYSNATPRADDLKENAIVVVDGGDGKFDPSDYILFYGQGPHRWSYNTFDNRYHHSLNLYSDTTYYFITTDLGVGKRILTQLSTTVPATNNVNSFDDYEFHEQDNVNLIKSGREWFGEIFDIITSNNFSFYFPFLDTSTPVYIKSNVAVRSLGTASSFSVSANSQPVITHAPATAPSCYWCTYAIGTEASTTFNASGSSISVSYAFTKGIGANPGIGWLNYLELNVRRQLLFSGNQMLFRDMVSTGTGKVSDFVLGNTNPSTVIWDVTDPANVRLQSVTVSGSSHNFRLPTDSLKEFCAFDGSYYYTPSLWGTVPNQNLHGMSQVDLIIVSHPLFLTEANRLAEFHQTADKLKTAVVTPQEIYNEFSSGGQDVSAIRDFVKMFYDRATATSDLPKNLLLFGDGSYDPKYRLSGNTNFIPTYQSDTWDAPTTSYVSDDFFGLLDDNEGNWAPGDADLPDIGIGRLPAKNNSEAAVMVNKIFSYANYGVTANQGPVCADGKPATSFGDWRNVVAFVGDDEDGNTHQWQSDSLARMVTNNYPSYNVDKIFFDAYVQESTPGGQRYPDVRDAINKRIGKGALLLNYTGHGGEVGWAHERVLEIADINSWKNYNSLFTMMTATCEFSRFDDATRSSAGELVILNPLGGGVALFSTVRLVFAAPNFELNRIFYLHAFNPLDSAGNMPSMGEIFRRTKRDAGPQVNNRNFTLLGDPALKLAYPLYQVKTTSVKSDTLPVDTLKALSKVTIRGEITDGDGQKLSGFNGIIYPTVFDKPTVVSTLGNDPGSYVATFSLQKNVLYRGKATVTNGQFSFIFVVPKDIAYQFGNGKVSYYATNNTTDASGYFDKIIIGGSSADLKNDVLGPEIKLFMNDEKFAFGGTTNENPTLLAVVYDSTGINMVGNGIGHDITATLDNSNTNIITLNDYYEADTDSSHRGKVRYPFSDLSEGRHTLKFKIWDVYNNSSESFTEFVVASSASLALKYVLNYPNPFTTHTSFYFEHNQVCEELEVQIKIFTVSGKIIKTINTRMHPEGFRAGPIAWDGKDEFGQKIARGVYIYHLKVRSQAGSFADEYQKLVILN